MWFSVSNPKFRRLVLLVIAVVSLSLSVSPAAEANGALGRAPVLGACGVWTAESKLVYAYGGDSKSRRLLCGNENFGFRHIRARHKSDFQYYAQMGGLQYYDLMHWVIHYNFKDPDRFKYSGNGKYCRSRSMHLRNPSGTTFTKIFRVIYSTSGVITAYPSRTHC